MSVASGIDLAFDSSPDLLNTPGLALDASNSLDPTTFAPVVSHLSDVQASTTAVGQANAEAPPQDNGGGGGGFWHSIGHVFQSIPGIHSVEHGLGIVIHYASAPIREIQRDYRFVHTVWTKNGPVAGFLATLGVTAGAALGAWAGGPEGAILGGEGVAALERQGAEAFGGHGQGYTANGQTNFNEGLAATADASSDPHMKISFGRDLSNALGHVPGLHTLTNTDRGVGKFVSGGTDAASDWIADPIVVAAKVKTGLKLGEMGSASKAIATGHMQQAIAQDGKVRAAVQGLLSGDLLRSMQSDASAQWIDKVAPGIQLRTTAAGADASTLPLNSEQLTNLYNSPVAGASYRRALDHISTLSTGDIIARYPELEPLAPNVLKASDGQTTLKGLGSAQTAEQAHQVFVNVAENKNFADRLNSLAVVPTRTLTRVPASRLAEWAQNVHGGDVADQKSLTGGALSAAKNLATGNPGAAVGDIAGAIARKVRTFSGYMPFALDKNTLDLSSHSFTVDAATQRVSPTAAKGILNSFRFSMGESRARYWTDQFLNAPDLGTQKRIWAEANVEMLKAAGLPDKNELIQNVRQQLADLEAGPMGEPKNVFGVGAEKGSDVSLQPAGDWQAPAALWNHQASAEFSFPQFAIVKQQMREMQGSIKANYGKFDDFFARKYVQSIFKPLALLNAGFGLRVAFAEAIPQAMRVGALKTLRDAVNAKAARMQYNLSSDEPDHILAAAAHALGAPQGAGTSMVTGINRLLNDPESRSRAIDLIVRHQGHIAQGVARTGESTGGWSIDQDPSTKAQIGAYTVQSELKNHPQLKWAGSKDFDTFTPDSDLYDGYWHGALSRVSQEKPAQLISADLLAGSKEDAIAAEADRIQKAADGHPDALPAYLHEAPALRGYDNIKAHNWTAQDFAANRVDAIRGLTEGADGTVHTPILQNLADGRKPDINDLAAIEKPSRPVQVYGPQRVPYIGKNVMQRVISGGFQKVIDPIINGLSRDPMYFNNYSTQLDHLMPAVKAGTLDQETAQRIAETRAVVGILPKIHNTALRSQFSVLARNYMPFYFAQEQALRRAGKLIATNPEAYRQYQLVEHGLNDPGFIQKDDQGNRFFVFPKIGALSAGANGLLGLFGDSVQSGLPMTVQGSMSSLNVLLPDFQSPGVSPLVSVPLNKLAGIFPELSPSVKDIVGPQGFNQAAIDAIIPHPIAKAAWRVLAPDEKDAAYANALFTSMATSFYNGSAPGTNASTAEKADWINRMKNNARSTFIVKGLLGLVSPLAPQVSNQTQEESGFRTEFFNEVKKSGYKTALADFLDKHGTRAISYTVAHSTPSVNGAYLPYTNDAINAINGDLQPLIHSPLSVGAAFLVPQAQGAGDIQTIHAELVRNHLRSQDTPQQFLDAIDIALGNNAISPALAVHQQAQAAAANNPSQLAAENKNWADYVKVQTLANPTWGDYWASPERTQLAFQAWAQLKSIFEARTADGNPLAATQTPQGQLVQGLMQDYANHALEMAQTTRASQRKVEKANWSAYLDQTATQNPLAYSVINAVFARLDSAGVTPNGGTVG